MQRRINGNSMAATPSPTNITNISVHGKTHTHMEPSFVCMSDSVISVGKKAYSNPSYRSTLHTPGKVRSRGSRSSTAGEQPGGMKTLVIEAHFRLAKGKTLVDSFVASPSSGTRPFPIRCSFCTAGQSIDPPKPLGGGLGDARVLSLRSRKDVVHPLLAFLHSPPHG